MSILGGAHFTKIPGRANPLLKGSIASCGFVLDWELNGTGADTGNDTFVQNHFTNHLPIILQSYTARTCITGYATRPPLDFPPYIHENLDSLPVSDAVFLSSKSH